VWEGGREETMGLNAVAGKPRELRGSEPARFEDMIQGCHDPSDGTGDVRADTPFPNVQAAFKALFEGTPAEEVELMTRSNAEEVSASRSRSRTASPTASYRRSAGE
jgi:hypothetical protein